MEIKVPDVKAANDACIVCTAWEALFNLARCPHNREIGEIAVMYDLAYEITQLVIKHGVMKPAEVPIMIPSSKRDFLEAGKFDMFIHNIIAVHRQGAFNELISNWMIGIMRNKNAYDAVHKMPIMDRIREIDRGRTGLTNENIKEILIKENYDPKEIQLALEWGRL